MSTPKVSMIVATNREYLIGEGPRIPWDVSGDMLHFKNTTMGCPVIMGRLTWESMGGRLLPNRLNIVVTSDRTYGHAYPELINTGSLENAIGYALVDSRGAREVFVMGGGQLYAAALAGDYIDTIYHTVVECPRVPRSDSVYLTGFDPTQWDLRELSSIRTDVGTRSNSGLDYRFHTYRRLPR